MAISTSRAVPPNIFFSGGAREEKKNSRVECVAARASSAWCGTKGRKPWN